MHTTFVKVVSGRPGYCDSDVFTYEIAQEPTLEEIQTFMSDAQSYIFFEPVRNVRVRVEETGKNRHSSRGQAYIAGHSWHPQAGTQGKHGHTGGHMAKTGHTSTLGKHGHTGGHMANTGTQAGTHGTHTLWG